MNLSYEKAKELKDAGFPQKLKYNCHVQYTEEDIRDKGYGCPDKCCPEAPHKPYIPTLSELIEGCGDGFRGLIRKQSMFYAVTEDVSSLTIDFKEDMDTVSGSIWFCSTPEEAIASLWLALNKK